MNMTNLNISTIALGRGSALAENSTPDKAR